MTDRVYGHSQDKRPLRCQVFGSEVRPLLIIGAIHGDELPSYTLVSRFAEYLRSRPESLTRSVAVIAVANPDGLRAATRQNINGVDINRNFPTKDWKPSQGRYSGGPSAASEPETQALIKLVEDLRPRSIVSVHVPLHVINFDGPAEGLARAMSSRNGYRTDPSIGYSTPGSFGTWAGKEREIPVVTLELEGGQSDERLWKDNVGALLAAVAYPDIPPNATFRNGAASATLVSFALGENVGIGKVTVSRPAPTDLKVSLVLLSARSRYFLDEPSKATDVTQKESKRVVFPANVMIRRGKSANTFKLSYTHDGMGDSESIDYTFAATCNGVTKESVLTVAGNE